MTSEGEMAKTARKRAEAKAGFWVHLGIFVVVNAFLAGQWWLITGGSGFPWFLTVLLGWGIDIVAHFLSAFAGGRYVDRETQKELQRLRQQRG